MKKLALLIFTFSILIGIYFVAPTVSKLLKAGPAFRAKMYCSCRFVTNQNDKFCMEYSSSSVLPGFMVPVKVLEDEKIIKVDNMLYRSSAAYMGKEQGCIIQ